MLSNHCVNPLFFFCPLDSKKKKKSHKGNVNHKVKHILYFLIKSSGRKKKKREREFFLGGGGNHSVDPNSPTKIFLSLLHETMMGSSWWKAISFTDPLCPGRRYIKRLDSKSQMYVKPSADPADTYLFRKKKMQNMNRRVNFGTQS